MIAHPLGVGRAIIRLQVIDAVLVHYATNST